jgi:hypothetical protein
MKKIVLFLIGVFLLYFIGSGIYEQLNKKSAKSARLECHKKSTVFENLQRPELLESLRNSLESSKYSIETSVEKAVYMQSRLFEYVDPKEAEKYVLSTLEKYKKAGSSGESKNAQIKLLIYENDKKDPGKKSDKAKLYAGYLLFDFIVDNKTVYKIQIDFMDDHGKDINQKIECAIKSLFTYKG